MKKILKAICIIALSVALSFCVMSCEIKTDNTAEVPEEEYLYNWLLENGRLVNGTALVYEESLENGKTVALHYDTGYSHELFAKYTSNCDGYELEVMLPLLTDSNKGITWITLVNSDDFARGLEYYHNPDTFTKKTPIEHGDTFGDILFTSVATKEEIEELEKMNELCEELAHESLCSILDWLNESLCPKAQLKISDLGYLKY